jgi:hypothetical protein
VLIVASVEKTLRKQKVQSLHRLGSEKLTEPKPKGAAARTSKLLAHSLSRAEKVFATEKKRAGAPAIGRRLVLFAP